MRLSSSFQPPIHLHLSLSLSLSHTLSLLLTFVPRLHAQPYMVVACSHNIPVCVNYVLATFEVPTPKGANGTSIVYIMPLHNLVSGLYWYI